LIQAASSRTGGAIGLFRAGKSVRSRETHRQSLFDAQHAPDLMQGHASF
jgi:hypothetical protein